MPQLSFAQNLNVAPNGVPLLTAQSLNIFGFNLLDSISLKTIQVIVQQSASTNATYSLSIGLYSLNGATLTLVNSASNSSSQSGVSRFYFSMTNTSATSNLTPGTWYFGLLLNTAGDNVFRVYGGTRSGGNAFPGGFIQGQMTDATTQLPLSIATSNLNITGVKFIEPYIILSS